MCDPMLGRSHGDCGAVSPLRRSNDLVPLRSLDGSGALSPLFGLFRRGSNVPVLSCECDSFDDSGNSSGGVSSRRFRFTSVWTGSINAVLLLAASCRRSANTRYEWSCSVEIDICPAGGVATVVRAMSVSGMVNGPPGIWLPSASRNRYPVSMDYRQLLM